MSAPSSFWTKVTEPRMFRSLMLAFWALMATLAAVSVANIWWRTPVGVVTIEPLQPISVGFVSTIKPRPKPVRPAARPLPPLNLNLPGVKLFQVRSVLRLNRAEFDCLARNIYFEARGESRLGKLGVAQITHNRVRSGRWGRTFCDVVYARRQFSWTNDLSRLQLPHGPDWTASRAAALDYTRGARVTRLKSANHYHARSVNPRWAHTMQARARVGAHIFYADAK